MKESVRSPNPRTMTFRNSEILQTAMEQFCAAEDRTISQACRMALKQFLPAKYVEEAKRKLGVTQ